VRAVLPSNTSEGKSKRCVNVMSVRNANGILTTKTQRMRHDHKSDSKIAVRLFFSASELLVERKSVLDCRRILRIFSHKKEVNKKTKKKNKVFFSEYFFV
jgi:hypothetical protein